MSELKIGDTVDISLAQQEARRRMDEQIKHKWISSKDKLPDIKGYYLCTYIFDGHRFYYDRWFNGFEFATTDTITHWMPLPNPPEVNHE